MLPNKKVLRLEVLGGEGCGGYKYNFELESR
jgi:hypothetical protein